MRTRTKAFVAGGAAVVVLATGGVAVASESGTTAGHGQPTGTTTGHTGKGHGPGDHQRIEHGQFVTKDAAGAQITHDIVDGTVTAVSGTSIAVKDGTGTTTTFTVDAKTVVHGTTKGSTIAIGAVKTGQHVTVQGTGTGPFVATRIRER